ncbi:alpha/beta fold hydrolase [Segniliparus rugosus]|uniref:alpha/beta fold hydrolase n=1 Tax=Segniliparus rugosus TaxID=286804 RepID=UPI000685FB85|nr:alpha/beta hydrolase [Segniliparus rugosus]
MSALLRLIRFALPPVGALASVATGGLLWPVKPQTRADFAPPKHPGRESWVESTGGVRLRVVEYGPADAPPLVFAHGWTCTAEVWLPQVHALAGEFRVIAYDQRGHGQSEGESGPFHVDLLGDDLSAVLGHTLREGERAVVAGHSMGGMTIMSWAARYPEEVPRRAKSVVLTATAVRELPSRIKIQPLTLFSSAGEETMKKAVSALSAALSAPLNLWLLRSAWATRFLVRHSVLCAEASDADVDRTAEMALTCARRSRGGWFQVLAFADLVAGLRNLTVPTVVVAGLQDRLLPVEHSYEMAAELVETGWLERLVVVPGSGHMVQLEATEQYNALLRETARTASSATAGAGR